MAQVLTMGEALAVVRPHGPTPTSRTADVSVAGAEANVAIALARLGVSVAYVGAVSVDGFGDLVLRTLRAENVDVSSVRRSPRQSGVALFNELRPGVTVVDYLRTGSAGSTIDAREVEAALLSHRPAIVHLTGITPALSAESEAAVRHAATRAAATGRLVSLDVNYRGRLWSRDHCRDVLTSLIPLVDLVIASDDEIDLVSGLTDAGPDDHAAALLDRGVATVLVKHGPEGATEYRREGVRSVAGTPVTEVDPVGAGDAFSAGYLSAVLDKAPDGLERACALGAQAVSTRGDWEGLPTRAQLAQLGHRPGTTLR